LSGVFYASLIEGMVNMKNNKYRELKERQQHEVHEFPFFFAYNDEQFTEGMKRFGLSIDDTDKIYKFGDTGGFYLRSDAARLREMGDRHEAEREAAIAADKRGNGYIFHMFRDELINHEFTHTGDLTDTLDALCITVEAINNNPSLRRGLDKAIADLQRKRRKKK